MQTLNRHDLLRRLTLAANQPSGARAAHVVLALAMVASSIVALVLGRGTFFTGDEMAWIANSPGLDLKGVFHPHSGHLVAIPRLLYKLILDTADTSYIYFRLLTLAALLSTVVLLYLQIRMRVGDVVALAPCLILLFFGPAAVHFIQGNGFTILGSIACGLAALLAVQRGNRRSDLLACFFLCLGVATYTVALGFVAGIAVYLLWGGLRVGLSRIWVVAIPAALYFAWRLWLMKQGIEPERGGVSPSYILLLPTWAFQSIGGVMAAATGLSYDFVNKAAVPPWQLAGPPLALVACFFWVRALLTRSNSRDLWVASSILIALLSLQVVAWIPVVRLPGADRYLFPTGIALALVAAEIFRNQRWGPRHLAVLSLIVLCAISVNIVVLRDKGASLRDSTPHLRAQILALELISEIDQTDQPLSPAPDAEAIAIPGGGDLFESANRHYGRIGFSEEELAREPDATRAYFDNFFIKHLGTTALPIPTERVQLEDCKKLDADSSGTATAEAGDSRLVLKRSDLSQPIHMGRFADTATIPLSGDPGSQTVEIQLRDDGAGIPWRINSPATLVWQCDA